jgi:iron complex transport system permease protein
VTAAPVRRASPHRLRAAAVLGGGVALLVGVGLWHLGQGAAVEVELGEVVAGLLGDADTRVDAVTRGARLPRLFAGVISGAALGVAGTLLQSVARNPLAEPGTLAVNAGAYVAVVAVTAFGVQLGGFGRLGVAFLGAAVAALLVGGGAPGGPATPARLILAGMAVTLALSGVTAGLQLLFEQRTAGLFLWGQGSLAQTGNGAVLLAWPRLAVGAGAALLLGRRLDVLALGDDTAAGLGVRVRPTQLATVVTAVLLAATAVTLTGPIGFVGLAAPHLVRLAGVYRHRPLLVGAAVWGAVLLVAADAVARGVRSSPVASELPAGVVTAVVGAPLLIWLVRRTNLGRANAPTVHRQRTPRSQDVPVRTVALVGVVLAAALIAAVRLGDVAVPAADLLALVRGEATPLVERVVIDLRLPRTVVALLAGACLAVAGSLLQSVTRNPLASPATLGLIGGASLGALTVLLVLPDLPVSAVPVAAFAGALAAAGAVHLLAARSGTSPEALVLTGVAVAALTTGLVYALVVGAELRTAQALTWLSGSVYARTWGQTAVLAVWAAVLLPLAWTGARVADVIAVDDDLPRTLGIRAGRARAALTGIAVLLAAVAVSVVGAMTFVGLLAPHAARLLVGANHRWTLPTAMLLGATLVVVADTVGRTVLAPTQIPAGLVTALLGAPYFVWTLRRA